MEASSTAIGIDLGTTHCCAAVFNDGVVKVICNDMGGRVTPSYVAFTQSERVIGEAAKDQAHRNGSNTIFDAKRLIGRKYSDEVVQIDRMFWPFTVVQGQHDQPLLKVEHEGVTKKFPPQQISSMLLSRMKKFAEDFLDTEVTQAVITAPAYFNNSQRSATVEAGKIAGLEVLRIISEPVAAALTYGLQPQKGGSKKVLIYDLGGGTCDVSILDITGRNFDVLAKSGDMHLGGEDFDKCLVDHFMKVIQRKFKTDLSQNVRARRRLHSAAEHAKRTLSSKVHASVEVAGLVAGQDFCTTVTRACFEDLCEDHFRRCMEPVPDCLAAAGLSVNQIDDVVLVGGSTRIPHIQYLLQKIFNEKTLNKTVNPDEAVAYGAAVQAATLTGKGTPQMRSLRLQDVTPLSLGFELMGNRFEVLIPRNTKIPATIVRTGYTTVKDNQTEVTVIVYEGERLKASANNALGQFRLTGLPRRQKGKIQCEITFSLDEDGMLSVKAQHIGTENSGSITIDHSSNRHSQDVLDQLIRDAARYRQVDEAVCRSHTAKNDLMEYSNGIQNALRSGMQILLSQGDVEALHAAVQKVTQWLESETQLADAWQYDNKKTYLEELCEAALKKARRAPPDEPCPACMCSCAAVATHAS